MKKPQPNKDIFSLLCGQSRKSPIVVQKSAQLRETFNKHFLLQLKKPDDTCISRNSEKEKEVPSFSTVTRDNFKQYLIIIFRLFLSLSKAENGHISRILSPVFQNVK